MLSVPSRGCLCVLLSVAARQGANWTGGSLPGVPHWTFTRADVTSCSRRLEATQPLEMPDAALPYSRLALGSTSLQCGSESSETVAAFPPLLGRGSLHSLLLLLALALQQTGPALAGLICPGTLASVSIHRLSHKRRLLLGLVGPGSRKPKGQEFNPTRNR